MQREMLHGRQAMLDSMHGRQQHQHARGVLRMYALESLVDKSNLIFSSLALWSNTMWKVSQYVQCLTRLALIVLARSTPVGLVLGTRLRVDFNWKFPSAESTGSSSRVSGSRERSGYQARHS